MYGQGASVREYVRGVRRVEKVCAPPRSLIASIDFDRSSQKVTIEFKKPSKMSRLGQKINF